LPPYAEFLRAREREAERSSSKRGFQNGVASRVEFFADCLVEASSGDSVITGRGTIEVAKREAERLDAEGPFAI